MTQQRPASRLVAVLWTLAALLAWTAVAIRYAREGTIDWRAAAAGLLCAAFAVGAWNRLRSQRTLT
jgi:hypothetical protein